MSSVGANKGVVEPKDIIRKAEENIKAKEKERLDKIKEVEDKYNAEIKDLETAIEMVKKICVKPCPRCDGLGFHYEVTGMPYGNDKVRCKICKGKGEVSIL